MKLTIIALLVAVAFASQRHDEMSRDRARNYQLDSNRVYNANRDSSAYPVLSVQREIEETHRVSRVSYHLSLGGSNRRLPWLFHGAPSSAYTNDELVFANEQTDVADGDTETSVCKECVLVAGWIKTALKDGEKLEEYKGLLEMLCGYLSSDEKTECLAIVDNLPAYIHQLEPLLDNPKQFCAEFGLCGTNQIILSAVGRKILHHLALRAQGSTASNDVVCDECLFMTKELKTIISEQSTEEEVKEMLESTCSSLGSYANECKSLIDQYFPLAWDELEALLADSRGLCDQLGMCQSSRQAGGHHNMMRLRPAVVSESHDHLPSRPTPTLDARINFLRHVQTENGVGGACVLCKMGLTEMLDYARHNPQAIKNAEKAMRQELCQEVIPSEYESECTAFMKEYLEPAITMVLGQLSAEEVCDAWELCSATDLRAINHRRLTPEMKANMLCQACTVVAEFAQHEATDKAVQADIEHYLDQTCQQLPQEVQAACKDMVDQYLPAIWEYAQTELNPEVICPEIGLCPSEDDLKKDEDITEF